MRCRVALPGFASLKPWRLSSTPRLSPHSRRFLREWTRSTAPPRRRRSCWIVVTQGRLDQRRAAYLRCDHRLGDSRQPRYRFASRPYTELLEDVPDVDLHRREREHQGVRDVLISVSAGDKTKHLQLPWREQVSRFPDGASIRRPPRRARPKPLAAERSRVPDRSASLRRESIRQFATCADTRDERIPRTKLFREIPRLRCEPARSRLAQDASGRRARTRTSRLRWSLRLRSPRHSSPLGSLPDGHARARVARYSPWTEGITTLALDRGEGGDCCVHPAGLEREPPRRMRAFSR